MQEIQELCPPQTAKRRTWKKTIRIARGWFYITFSNCRVKKRDTCGYSTSWEFALTVGNTTTSALWRFTTYYPGPDSQNCVVPSAT